MPRARRTDRNSAFGAWLEAARVEAKLSVSGLARLVGVNYSMISMLENGSMRPSEKTRMVVRLAGALEVDAAGGLAAAQKDLEMDSLEGNEEMSQVLVEDFEGALGLLPGNGELTRVRPIEPEKRALSVSLDAIESGENAREDFGDLEALAESIRVDGVRDPIKLRPAALAEGRYVIVYGERRFRASKIAGLDRIPAYIDTGLDDKAASLLHAKENFERKDLNPVERARAFEMMERARWTHAEIALNLNISRSDVSNALRLLKLPAQVLEWVKSRDLDASKAEMLASPDLTTDDVCRLAQGAVAESWTYKQLQVEVAEVKRRNSPGVDAIGDQANLPPLRSSAPPPEAGREGNEDPPSLPKREEQDYVGGESSGVSVSDVVGVESGALSPNPFPIGIGKGSEPDGDPSGLPSRDEQEQENTGDGISGEVGYDDGNGGDEEGVLESGVSSEESVHGAAPGAESESLGQQSVAAPQTPVSPVAWTAVSQAPPASQPASKAAKTSDRNAPLKTMAEIAAAKHPAPSTLPPGLIQAIIPESVYKQAMAKGLWPLGVMFGRVIELEEQVSASSSPVAQSHDADGIHPLAWEAAEALAQWSNSKGALLPGEIDVLNELYPGSGEPTAAMIVSALMVRKARNERVVEVPARKEAQVGS